MVEEARVQWSNLDTSSIQGVFFSSQVFVILSVLWLLINRFEIWICVQDCVFWLQLNTNTQSSTHLFTHTPIFTLLFVVRVAVFISVFHCFTESTPTLRCYEPVCEGRGMDTWDDLWPLQVAYCCVIIDDPRGPLEPFIQFGNMPHVEG